MMPAGWALETAKPTTAAAMVSRTCLVFIALSVVLPG
jgi:hypothetical protein